MDAKRKYEQWSLRKVNKRMVGTAIALVLFLPVAAWAGGVVTNCTEAALRGAMAGGGVVTFACDGTITLARTITNVNDITLDGSGRQVTVSGSNTVRVFSIATNVYFTAVNLTIADGKSLGGSAILNLGGTINLTGVTLRSNTATWAVSNDALSPQASGGAIFNRGGTVKASNCSFTGNTAQSPAGGDGGPDALVFGGAIRNEAGQVDLRSCAFVSNRAWGGATIPRPPSGPANTARGGAIHNSGTVTLDRCSLAGNSATGGDGVSYYDCAGGLGGEGSGGAIFNEGTMTVDRTTLSGNTAMGGTGGPGSRGDMYAGTSSALDGYVGGNGGGAYGAAICGGAMWIIHSTLVSNLVVGGNGGLGGGGVTDRTGEYGGDGGPGGNGGTGVGGAVDVAGSLVNCTIAFNTASGGSGGRGGDGAAGPRLHGGRGGPGGNGGPGQGGVEATNLTHCTVAWNRGSGGWGGAGGQGGLGPGGAPGVPGTNGATYGGPGSSTWVNTLLASNTPAGDDTFIDPKLGPLADNGGPTLTMALLPGSPAIDAGNTSLAPTTDERGFPRPAGLAADVGAFEYGSVMPAIAVSRSGTNGLNILGSGNAGQSCRLLGSTDLSSWVPLATNQFGANGTVLFYDNYAPGSACRLYRLEMP
jgi:hypothetical protein